MLCFLLFVALFEGQFDHKRLDESLLINLGPGGLRYAIRMLSNGTLNATFRENELKISQAQLTDLKQESQRVVAERAITRKALVSLFPSAHPIFDELETKTNEVLNEAIAEKLSPQQKLAIAKACFQINFVDDIQSKELATVFGLTENQKKVFADLSYERELSNIDSDLKKEINKQHSMVMKFFVTLDGVQREKALYMLGVPIEKGNWVQAAMDYHRKKNEEGAVSKDR